MGKDVTAKCYGGDVRAQAEAAGEAERGEEADEKRVGKVDIPQEAFIQVLKAG